MWHPDKSLVQGVQEDYGCEERGRGSYVDDASRPTKVKIVRWRQPTVDIRAVSLKTTCVPSCEKSEKTAVPEQRLQNYATVEQNGEKGEQALLTYAAQFWEGARSAQQLKGRADFCGWVENEPLGKYASSSHRAAPCGSDRFAAQTPAEGCRSTLQSRASSRPSGVVSGRRRCSYDFVHFQDARDYIEHYRKYYCYTTLNVQPTPASRRECRVLVAEEAVDENPDNFMPLGVRSLYRGDPYLRELASRLGVRESFKEPQLLRTQRPTPPSIVKKTAKAVDLAVCSNGKKEDDAQISSSEKISAENSIQASPKTSRQTSNSSNAHNSEGRSAAVELPHITHARQRQRHKSNSVISVAKYLQVSSHANPNPSSLEREEVDGNASGSNHSVADELLSSVFSSESISQLIDKSESSIQGTDEASFPPKSARVSLQEQLPLLDEGQKEKLIARKAQALGLISRDWVKTPHIRRMIGNYIWEDLQESETYRCSYSKQSSRETANLRSGHSESQSCEGALVTQQERQQQRVPSSSVKLKTLQHQPIDRTKLEKIRSIYEPSHERKKRESPSRLHSTRNQSRAVSRAVSRPATRIITRGAEIQDRSQPATRASKRFRDVRGDKLAAQLSTAVGKEADKEDCYWNEVLTNKDTRKLSKQKQDSEFRNISRCVTRSSSGQHHSTLRNDYLLTRPVTQETGVLRAHKDSQHRHSLAIAVRLRKPSRVGRTGTDIRALSPGAGPDQISAHATRMRRQFEGILDIHHHKVVST